MRKKDEADTVDFRFRTWEVSLAEWLKRWGADRCPGICPDTGGGHCSAL